MTTSLFLFWVATIYPLCTIWADCKSRFPDFPSKAWAQSQTQPIECFFFWNFKPEQNCKRAELQIHPQGWWLEEIVLSLLDLHYQSFLGFWPFQAKSFICELLHIFKIKSLLLKLAELVSVSCHQRNTRWNQYWIWGNGLWVARKSALWG